jgi:hypothetical protein
VQVLSNRRGLSQGLEVEIDELSTGRQEIVVRGLPTLGFEEAPRSRINVVRPPAKNAYVMPGLDVARYTLRQLEDDGNLTTF